MQSSPHTSRILPTPTSEPIARPHTPPRPKQLLALSESAAERQHRLKTQDLTVDPPPTQPRVGQPSSAPQGQCPSGLTGSPQDEWGLICSSVTRASSIFRWLLVTKDLSPHTTHAYETDIAAFERHLAIRRSHPRGGTCTGMWSGNVEGWDGIRGVLLMGDNNTSRPKHRWVSPVTGVGWSSQRMSDEARSPPRSLMDC